MTNNIYVTDLDGSLLNSEGELSKYSVGALNFLMQRGVNITFATARSFASLKVILKGVNMTLPVICLNGGQVWDPTRGRPIKSVCMDKTLAQEVYALIGRRYDLLISLFDGHKDTLQCQHSGGRGIKAYINDRQRLLGERVEAFEGFNGGQVMAYTVIGDGHAVLDLAHVLKEKYTKRLQIEVWEDMYYKPYYWLALHDPRSTKGEALRGLKEYLDKPSSGLVVFGDQANDLDMFEVADQAYAVANAIDALKELANETIGYHYNDSVVKKILEMEGIDYDPIQK